MICVFVFCCFLCVFICLFGFYVTPTDTVYSVWRRSSFTGVVRPQVLLRVLFQTRASYVNQSMRNRALTITDVQQRRRHVTGVNV
jgi:hypothetical protein